MYLYVPTSILSRCGVSRFANYRRNVPIIVLRLSSEFHHDQEASSTGFCIRELGRVPGGGVFYMVGDALRAIPPGQRSVERLENLNIPQSAVNNP